MRIFSGARPTGNLQLGNYLGAVLPWTKLVEQSQESIFCVVDWHALTTLEDAQDLMQNSRMLAATYIACGIDTTKAHIFVQSHVPQHLELMWYLSCIAPLGWLKRMTQFKDKAGKHSENACLGLLSYPVLMAADILLYQASHVPVGEDQKQHVELARDLTQVLNRRMGFSEESAGLTMPEPLIAKQGARIMSLRDGTKKMSKSDPSDFSRINLMDTADLVTQKIRKARSDSDPIPYEVEELEGRPEAKNLLTIYSLMREQSVEKSLQEFGGKLFSPFKEALIEVINQRIQPIRTSILELLEDLVMLDIILAQGAEHAQTIASKTIAMVRERLNVLQPTSLPSG